jgi:hypothetical protein
MERKKKRIRPIISPFIAWDRVFIQIIEKRRKEKKKNKRNDGDQDK